MNARAHMGMALIVGLALCKDDIKGFVYVPLMVVGSLLPDIDTPFSKLGRFNPFSPFMRHRGITHSLLAAGIVAVAGTLINLTVGIWATIGYLTHLMIDSITPSGVKWLYPFKR